MSKAERIARRRVDGAARKADTKGSYGPCFVDGCPMVRGRITQECVLCEHKDASFIIQSCIVHAGDARARLKRHVLLRHPSTIPAAIWAGLKGHEL